MDEILTTGALNVFNSKPKGTSKNTKTSVTTDRESAERLQIYEKLADPRVSEKVLDNYYTTFSIPSKGKHKKVALAEHICKCLIVCFTVMFVCIGF